MEKLLIKCVGLILLSAIFWGCESVPEPVDRVQPASVSLEKEANILNEARVKIGIASPVSLLEAYTSIQTSDAAKTEMGLELSYVAYKILQIVYPYSLENVSEVFPPAAGIYQRMFQEIEAGRYPRVDTADVSFLTLLVPSLSALFSQDEEIENRCIEASEQAMEVNPASVLPIYLRGFIAEQNDNLELAETLYSDALTTAASCYPASVGAVSVALKSGDIDTAVERIKPIMYLVGVDVRITVLAAKVELEIGNISTAANIAVTGLRSFPNNVDLLLIRTRVLVAEGNYNQASRFLAVAENSIPNDPKVLLLRGDLAFHNGKYREAADAYRRGMEIEPEDIDFILGYGKALLALGEREQGRRLLMGIIDENSDNTEVILVLLQDAVELQEWDSAAEYADKLMETDIQDGEVYQLAYTAFTGHGDGEKAVHAAARLYDMHPADPDVAFMYADALISTQQGEKALSIIENGLDDTRSPELRSNLYYLQSLAVSDDRTKLEVLQAALYENLQNIDALIAIARTYARLGEYRMAYRYMKQAVALRPGDVQLGTELDEFRKKIP